MMNYLTKKPLVVVRVGAVPVARGAHVLEAVVEERPDSGDGKCDGEDDDCPVGGGHGAGGQVEDEDPGLSHPVCASQKVIHIRHCYYCT